MRRRRRRRSTKAKEHKAFFQNPKVRLGVHSSAKKRAEGRQKKILVDKNSQQNRKPPKSAKRQPRDDDANQNQNQNRERARAREREREEEKGRTQERERRKRG
jgi:hypothetical protein